MHRVGIVGAGHWSRRLKKGFDDDVFEIAKTVDVLDYDDKAGLLRDLGVDRTSHYRIQQGDPLPEEFFDGLDVVQVASPVEFHHDQTLQCLERGVFTITEKSYGADRAEFESALTGIEELGAWDRSYLHLHYLKKLLTIRMPDVLERAVERHGAARRVEATFVEEESEEDAQRGWLFEPSNGGVMLDWIHPIEVLVDATGASFELLEGEVYRSEPRYSEYPTAAAAHYDVEGEYLAEDATATVRVGKGFDETHKVMRFVFDGGHVDFEYADSEAEFESDYRGRWSWHAGGEELEGGEPRGEIPYQIMADEVRHSLELGRTPLDEERIRAMYEPVWSFNETVDMESPVEDERRVREFFDEALKATRREVRA